MENYMVVFKGKNRQKEPSVPVQVSVSQKSLPANAKDFSMAQVGSKHRCASSPQVISMYNWPQGYARPPGSPVQQGPLGSWSWPVLEIKPSHCSFPWYVKLFLPCFPKMCSSYIIYFLLVQWRRWANAFAIMLACGRSEYLFPVSPQTHDMTLPTHVGWDSSHPTLYVCSADVYGFTSCTWLLPLSMETNHIFKPWFIWLVLAISFGMMPTFGQINSTAELQLSL